MIISSAIVRSARVGAVATLLGSLAFVSTVATSQDLSSREAFLLPAGVIGSGVAAVGLVLLVWAMPALLSTWPRWISATVTAALAFTLALAWFDATAIVGTASTTTDPVFDGIGSSAGVTSLFVPKSILGLVGFGALALVGWRRQLLDRRTAALFGIGAVVSALPPFPPGLVLVSLGFLTLLAGTPGGAGSAAVDQRRSTAPHSSAVTASSTRDSTPNESRRRLT